MDALTTEILIGALLLGALVFFLAEILTPTFGVLAGLGVAALIAAVWLSFTVSPVLGFVMIVAVAVLVPIYLAVLVKVLPKTPLGRRMFLAPAPEGTGDAAPEARQMEALVGREGVAETLLRPSGAVRIDGRRVIATAESGLIEKGESVRVLRVAGPEVVVRRTGGEPRGPQGTSSARS